MKLPRRKFLQLAISAGALPAVGQKAWAQAYPTRPITLIVPFAAGGVTDVIARIVAERVSRALGQPLIVENIAGAGGTTATTRGMRASPDGYTLLEASTSNAWNATLYQNLKFDFIRDIAPVASTVKTYNVMIVNSSFPAKTVPEFIAYAKANPGKINMGSAGPGSSPHLYGELFKAMTGVDMVTVHYRGDGPAIPELIAGRIQVMFGSVVTWAEQIKAGTVRALAVTSATRTQLLPDLPPIGEFVPGYEGIGWQGIGAPRGTPADVIAKLNAAAKKAVQTDAFKKRVEGEGLIINGGSPQDFDRYAKGEEARWRKVVKENNITAE